MLGGAEGESECASTAPSAAARLSAVCLCLDIAGFTAVAERLEQARGDEGIEDLVGGLNLCFQPVIEEAARFGGEVAAVCGDAVVILWPLEVADADPRPMLLAAARCAFRIVQRTREPGSQDESLAVRVTIGSGTVFGSQLTSEGNRNQLLIAGPLIVELFAICARAACGQVLLTPSARQLLGAAVLGESLSNGCLALTSLTGPDPPLPTGVETTERFHPALPFFVDSQQLEWLAELRAATVMFISFAYLSPDDPHAFERVRRSATQLDHLARAHSGLQEKILVDDKGFTALLSFGLPPRSGSYHPDQAFACAVAVRHALNEAGITVRIGIATGRVFRATVGSRMRRDFTIYGNAVHRAVRLMERAGTDIICDQASRAASVRYRFSPLPPLALRGMSAPAGAFALLAGDGPTRAGRLVGREADIAWIADRLASLRDGGPSIAALVGGAGFGKSLLLAAAIERARAMGVAVLHGAGTPLGVQAPYQAWRGVFRDLFGISQNDRPISRRARIVAHLADDAALLELAPLLEAVMPVGIPDNETTRAMERHSRALATRDLLTRLVARRARTAPTLIVFDDAHWLDDASVALLVEIWRAGTGVGVLLASRPDGDQNSTLPERLSVLEGREILVVAGLTATETEALLAVTLEAASISGDLVGWIQAAAGGHPLFTTELAKVLRERGLLTWTDGAVGLAIDRDALDSLALPSSVEGLVTDRLDRLGPVEQVAFKTASVIGVDFDFAMLEAVYPHPATRMKLRAGLDRLVEVGLMRARDGAAGGRFSFGHAIFRTAGYDHLPRVQRRALHLAIAEALEPAAAADPRSQFPRLAFHYRRARQNEKALHYLDLASRMALRDGTFEVAAQLVRQAIEICQDSATQDTDGGMLLRDWRTRLAKCVLSLGRLDEAKSLACGVLAELGYPWPEGRGGTLAMCAGLLLRQVGHKFLPARQSRRELEATVDAAALVHQADYFRADPLGAILSALLQTGCAARAGETIGAAEGYWVLCMLVGLLRLGPVHRRLLRRFALNVQRAGGADALWLYETCLRAHHLYFCRWAEVDVVQHRIGALRPVDPNYANNEITALACIRYFRGEFAAAGAAFSELGDRAEKQRNLLHLAWSRYGAAECLLPLGRVDQALALLLEADRLLADQADRHSRIICRGLLAIAHLRRRDVDSARAAGEDLARLVRTTSPNNFSSLEGYAGAVEVWLGLAVLRPEERRRCHDEARRALRSFRSYALLFPLGRPRLWLYRGYLHWQARSPRRALRAWRKSLAWAERNRMPYEIARAATALAMHARLPADRVQSLKELAVHAFGRSGASPRLGPMEEDDHARH